jgi:hypothetical protein
MRTQKAALEFSHIPKTNHYGRPSMLGVAGVSGTSRVVKRGQRSPCGAAVLPLPHVSRQDRLVLLYRPTFIMSYILWALLIKEFQSLEKLYLLINKKELFSLYKETAIYLTEIIFLFIESFI